MYGNEEPYIVAKKLRGSNRPYEINKAILAFLPMEGMIEKFSTNNCKQIYLSHYWDSWLRDDKTVLVGPIFGGPLCSVIVEELATLGVQYFIGYGASGALDKLIPSGSIMVAGSSFCSDGTSKEYSDDEIVYADQYLLDLIVEDIKLSLNQQPDIGTVWTTDAIYREFPSKVAFWKEKGARYVNLETGSLYSASKEIGTHAIYLSVVSDRLTEEGWSGWFEDFDQAIEHVWDICLKMVEQL